MASFTDITAIAKIASENKIFGVCVNSDNVARLKSISYALENKFSIVSVVGFPSGAHSMDSKVAEARIALDEGADEIDMVANIAKIKEGDLVSYQIEVEKVARAIKPYPGAKLKVIIESAILTDQEIKIASQIISDLGVHYVKTSTGYSTAGGASERAVQIILDNISPHTKVKASGGIKTFGDAEKYLKMGVDRIGASSPAVISKNAKIKPSNSDY